MRQVIAPSTPQLIAQRQQSPPDSHTIRSTDSGYSGASALLPPSPSTPARHFPFHHEPGRLPRGIYIGIHDSCRSLYRRFRERFSLFSASARTMPGFRRDRSLQVQGRTWSMSATASSHTCSSLRDHTYPPISRVCAGPGQYGSSTTKTPYPHHSPLVYPALLSRVAEALRSCITLSDFF